MNLIERLRHESPGPNHIATEAADRIEELEAARQRDFAQYMLDRSQWSNKSDALLADNERLRETIASPFTEQELEEIAFQEQFLLFCDMDEFKDIAKVIEQVVYKKLEQQLARIEELERELSQIKESPTMQAVRDMIESQAVKENDALLADNERLRGRDIGCR